MFTNRLKRPLVPRSAEQVVKRAGVSWSCAPLGIGSRAFVHFDEALSARWALNSAVVNTPHVDLDVARATPIPGRIGDGVPTPGDVDQAERWLLTLMDLQFDGCSRLGQRIQSPIDVCYKQRPFIHPANVRTPRGKSIRHPIGVRRLEDADRDGRLVRIDADLHEALA